MKVYALIDNREVNAYLTCTLFMNLVDAEAMQESYGSDKKYWEIVETEVIE